MLEGVMIYGHGESKDTLRQGDSLLLNGDGLHLPPQPTPTSDTIRSLAIAAPPDKHTE